MPTKNKEAKFKVLCGIHASIIRHLLSQDYVTIHFALVSYIKNRSPRAVCRNKASQSRINVIHCFL